MRSKPGSAEWYVYMVRCRDGALYTGIACDVERRFAEHRCGAGSKYLRGRGELHLVFRQLVGSRGRALQVERAVKRLPKRRKEELVAAGRDVAELLNPPGGGMTSC
ncbi:MAG: GIY-YIG nuclease family protein [Desulfobacterales bacterium]|nr:GIY-YIG nuclease family protein [Desulfobacterales bacterium]